MPIIRIRMKYGQAGCLFLLGSAASAAVAVAALRDIRPDFITGSFCLGFAALSFVTGISYLAKQRTLDERVQRSTEALRSMLLARNPDSHPRVPQPHTRAGTHPAPTTSRPPLGLPIRNPPAGAPSQQARSPRTWNDIEPIWRKWAQVDAPRHIQDACASEAKELNHLFLDLLARGVHERVLTGDLSESYQRGARLGETMAKSMRASYLIGLEYGSRNRGVPRSEEYMAGQVEVALPLLLAAAQPVNRLAAQPISLLHKPPNVPGLQVEEAASQIGAAAMRGILGCFRIGLEFSSHI